MLRKRVCLAMASLVRSRRNLYGKSLHALVPTLALIVQQNCCTASRLLQLSKACACILWIQCFALLQSPLQGGKLCGLDSYGT